MIITGLADGMLHVSDAAIRHWTSYYQDG